MSIRIGVRFPKVLLLLAGFAIFCCRAGARDSGPHWARISGAHFSILTDTDQKAAGQAIFRLEQMRAVFGQLLMKSKLNMSEPLDIVAFKDHDEYAQAALVRHGQDAAPPGLFLPGGDREYIVLDLSDPASWRAISRQLGAYFLNYNYPPAQPWFDEGFTEYFSSLQLDDRQVRMGSDPASFVGVLSAQPWMPIAELFSARNQGTKESESTVFAAESWLVMHYLLSQNKLSETGTYLGLVEVQKLPVTQAIQQAYGVSAEQFLGAIKEYFQSVAPALRVQTGSLTTTASSGPIQVDPSPLAPLDVGTSVHQLPPAEADALVAEMELRITERRAQAVDELRRLAGGTETETAVAHRALAWALLQEKKYAEAYQELQTASGLDKQDFWVHYYLALVPFEQSRTSASALEHLPNVMQDLHAVLDQHPDVAEAYNMLAMAQLEGGGVHAAASSIHYAMQLAPRNQGYVYNLAKIELAGKDWENATTLLTRLKGSSNSQIAAAAQQDLADLPTLRKYGVLPQRAGAKPAAAPAVVYNSGGDDEETSGEDQRPAQTGPDMRKSQYLQGKLLSVDCSQAPVAILRVTGKTKTLKLRTDDYKSLLLVGTDQFSCDWKDVPVVVNYKAGGKSDGDLVSLELR